MNNIHDFHQVKTTAELPLVIGFFDGLHKGHWKLFQSLKKKQFNILTFTNVPNKSHHLLYPDNARIADLQTLNPANIFILNLKIHNHLTMAFVDNLRKFIKPSYIILGSDFRFGKQRRGDVNQLKQFFKIKTVKVTPTYKTTIIKNYILKGNVTMANKLLFKPYLISGIVKHGKHIGRKLGYPTANIKLSPQTIQPKEGSYQAYTYINNVKYPSAVFIRNHLLESHVFKFHKNIYGKIISVELIKYHHRMNKTENFTSLQNVIKNKVESIQSTFE